MELERLLSSKGRVRVLRILLREGQVNISRLIRETGLHHRLVVKHLEELKRMGLVEERRYGRLRIYEANLQDPRVSALRELLKTLESILG
ncbi:MAG: ArsR/SmtB family transcription factor [Acidilobaceae archaeon]|jgi:DNA-binding transcriptional ArsR family regulator|nr:ArsR family transcriptional regulator [Desulfurococcaceae archaeon]MCC6060613.1 ArsR family transcriptional regulator [Desulfurococcaceae archaeon]